jgi:hypothetical protein
MAEHLYKELTRRHLPHWHPPDSTLFVTFRLADTIPQSTLRFYHAQKKWLQHETNALRKQGQRLNRRKSWRTKRDFGSLPVGGL